MANSLENALLKCVSYGADVSEMTTAGKRTSETSQQPIKKKKTPPALTSGVPGAQRGRFLQKISIKD